MTDLRRLAEDGVVSIRAAAVVVREPDGRFWMPEGEKHSGVASTAAGGVIGALLGALTGPARTVLGGAASLLLLLSLLFLPWYDLGRITQRQEGHPDYSPDSFVCGEVDFTCTGFETFPILRWLLLAAALAPAILAWILIRGHKLSWAPGELTMVVGFTAFVLVFYNGVIDRPGTEIAESGIGLDWGYFIALLATALMSATGFLRSQESGGRRARKAPGTV